MKKKDSLCSHVHWDTRKEEKGGGEGGGGREKGETIVDQLVQKLFLVLDMSCKGMEIMMWH